MSVDETEAKKIASEAISKAWQDAANQGVSSEIIASTALTAAMVSLVKLNGSEAVVRMTERLLKAVLEGRFDHAKH